MKRRLLALVAVAVLLAPGTWLRSPVPAPVTDAGIEIHALRFGSTRLGALSVMGVWHLRSKHALFGSYSGLAALGEGRFLAASDRGATLRFAIGGGHPGSFALSRFGAGGPGELPDKHSVDIEALARDPATGRIWAAFEGSNAIERREADLSRPVRVRPRAMAQWSGNSGPEAMARLADGRFVVLGEGATGWMGKEFPGLVFRGDPTAGGEPLAFTFRAPDGFRPTDMAPLPDGRVLLLVRRIAIGWRPYFETALLVADPGRIAAGQSWTGTELARFKPPFPADNFEGLAVDPAAGFPVVITMISDDNRAIYQRTLLLRFSWDGRLSR